MPTVRAGEGERFDGLQGRTTFDGKIAASKPSGTRSLRRLLLAATLSIGVIAPATAASTVPTLVVTATGGVSATPDLAVVTAGVVSEGRTTAEALAGADRTAAALLKEAEAAGIARADVATADFSVTPIWAQRSNGTPERITGYTVTNVFEVKVRRIADLGPLLERLVASGTNSVTGIAFDVSDAEKRRDEARVAAVKAARARADLLAEAAGERIVRVLAMTESSDHPMPRVFAKAALAGDRAVPVEPGTKTISATVTMTFELAPLATK